MMESATCDGDSKGLVKGRNMHQHSSAPDFSKLFQCHWHRFFIPENLTWCCIRKEYVDRMLYHREPEVDQISNPHESSPSPWLNTSHLWEEGFYITHKTVVGIDGRTQAVSPSGGCSIPWHSRNWKPHTRRLEGQNLMWITRWHRYQTSHTSCIIHQWFGVLLALPGRIDIKRMILPMFLWEACYCNNELTWLGMVSNPKGVLRSRFYILINSVIIGQNSVHSCWEWLMMFYKLAWNV